MRQVGASPEIVSATLGAEMRAWRRHLHQNPEFGFEERHTAEFIAQRLRAFGCAEVATGVGGTGVVATLRAGSSNRAVGLRADMDALRIPERTGLPYRSTSPGVMHACGHDGHVAMLLGAAGILAQEGGFDGVVQLIFQPAEEWGRGMQAMLDDGLLERFPMATAYGLHNMPGLPVGAFATRPGALMGAEDLFEIEIRGSGGHASRPHQTQDALLAACATVTALQSVVARATDPSELAVLSVTEIETDGTRNAIAGAALLKGDCRSFSPSISQTLEAAMRRVAHSTAEAHGCTAVLRYDRIFVPTVNDAEATAHACAAARGLGPTAEDTAPIGASEDFARLLQRVPGNFMFLGNGDSAVLHHPEYDFNDAALPYGAAYFVQLVRGLLAAE